MDLGLSLMERNGGGRYGDREVEDDLSRAAIVDRQLARVDALRQTRDIKGRRERDALGAVEGECSGAPSRPTLIESTSHHSTREPVDAALEHAAYSAPPPPPHHAHHARRRGRRARL